MTGSRSAGIAFRSFQGEDGLLACQADWKRVTADMASPAFFHCWEWAWAFARNLAGPADAIHVVMGYAGGEPVLVLPLWKRRDRVLGIRRDTLRLLNHDHAHLADLAVVDAIGADLWGDPLVSWLAANVSDWDVLVSPGMLARASIRRAFRKRPGVWDRIEAAGHSAHVDCVDPGADAIPVTTKFRRNLRRKLRRAGETGTVEFRCVREVDGLDHALEAFLAVERSGWKGDRGLGTAIALDPSLVGFYRDLVAGFGASGQCQINVMTLDGQPVAGQFCIRQHGVLSLLKIGFDEALAAISPGELLLFEVLDRCRQDPAVTRVSFVTDPPWVQRYQVDRTPRLRGTIYRRTVSGAVHLGLDAARGGFRDLCRRLRPDQGV